MDASLEDLHLLDIPHMVVDDIEETQLSSENKHHFLKAVSYTHLTLPTKA